MSSPIIEPDTYPSQKVFTVWSFFTDHLLTRGSCQVLNCAVKSKRQYHECDTALFLVGSAGGAKFGQQRISSCFCHRRGSSVSECIDSTSVSQLKLSDDISSGRRRSVHAQNLEVFMKPQSKNANHEELRTRTLVVCWGIRTFAAPRTPIPHVPLRTSAPLLNTRLSWYPRTATPGSGRVQ